MLEMHSEHALACLYGNVKRSMRTINVIGGIVGLCEGMNHKTHIHGLGCSYVRTNHTASLLN